MERTICLLFIAFLYGCSSDYSPKPVGYPLIEPEPHGYILLDNYPQFRFDIPDNVQINPSTGATDGEQFSILYPGFGVQIHCAYLPATASTIEEIKEDNLKLLSLQLRRADKFAENQYDDSINKVYCSLYSLEGHTAAPIHFYLTDNEKSFFRGELYFDNVPNRDSISPVLDYLSKDIHVLIESFRWKK